MSIEDQQVLRELAAEAADAFNEYGVSPAFDFIRAQAMDADQTVAFWSMLPSDMRSALKAEKKARDEAAKVVA